MDESKTGARGNRHVCSYGFTWVRMPRYIPEHPWPRAPVLGTFGGGGAGEEAAVTGGRILRGLSLTIVLLMTYQGNY